MTIDEKVKDDLPMPKTSALLISTGFLGGGAAAAYLGYNYLASYGLAKISIYLGAAALGGVGSIIGLGVGYFVTRVLYHFSKKGRIYIKKEKKEDKKEEMTATQPT